MAMDSKVVLLHLSDIHFHRKSSGTFDLDMDVRHELERDVTNVLRRIGYVTGVVVTGDIAFAGKAEEYAIAFEWLAQLCRRLRCPEENVWVTPGNHDVDRDVIRSSAVVRMMHKDLRQARGEALDRSLHATLEDPLGGQPLFAAMQGYNDFAAKFGCEVGPRNLFWQKDLTLNDGSILRLRGLTSTLVSDETDDDGMNRLLLGTLQSTPQRTEGVEYLTLCHHPPQWLIDQDTVEESLGVRARVQLYGHKHRQRIDRVGDTLRVTAGATHPDRREPGWTPRYNFLLLSTSGTGSSRHLTVEVMPRIWYQDRLAFGAEFSHEGSESRVHTLPIADWEGTTAPVPHDAGEVSPASSLAPIDPPINLAQGSNPMDSSRRMTYRFLSLAYHSRMAVVQRLGLLNDEDRGVADAELFRRFFRRANEKRVLPQLWVEIEKEHGVLDPGPNPFTHLQE